MGFKSLTYKLLAFILAVSLVPLLGISLFAYFQAKKRITEDRIKLYLEQIALDTSDKIDLTLLEKREEIRSAANTVPRDYLEPERRQELIALLNRLCLMLEVYDLLVVTDADGTIIATNTIDRFGNPIGRERLGRVLGRNVEEFVDRTSSISEKRWFEEARQKHSSQMDWYRSPLVGAIYDYENEDIARQYNIAFSEPIVDFNTGKVIGTWCGIINWEFIQRILDSVEEDLERLNLRTGYAFLFKGDANTVIGHKYRKNRKYHPGEKLTGLEGMNNYGTRVIEDHGLPNLVEAILRNERSFRYEYPPGTRKISGLARITDSFGWVCGVGINDEDIFRPVQKLKIVLIATTIGLSIIVFVSTYFISHGITVPLKRLTATAQLIARGDLQQRVQVQTRDEVGILAESFNEMASALSERTRQLMELTQSLEEKVRQRTQELERSNLELKKAFYELRVAQDQLVHSEKLASLGQLMAGIAHEIKNPLNFIYGNTGFLAQYVDKLQRLIEAYEQLPSLSAEDRGRIAELKRQINYDFLIEDLKALIDNFNEGAQRINAIVSDLRTFSRMDFDTESEVDLHASLDIALNLLRPQLRDRIAIHKRYGPIPKIRGIAGKLNQVFMNLISNAIQAIPERGDIWIESRLEDGWVVVQITDNGVGIPAQHLRKIFEPFFTTKGIGQGTGLGLSISYSIIEQHGGKILVESEVGKGSTFTVKLPTAEVPSSEPIRRGGREETIQT